MRLGLFNGGRLGAVHEGQVYDVSSLVGEPGPAGRLDAAIRAGITSIPSELLTAPAVSGDTVSVDDVQWEAPLPRPGKIIGAPANYYDHIDEMPNSATILEWGFFLKAATSVIGPNGTVEIPYTDVPTHHEGELAVVIGKGGRDISLDDAWDHVYGYTCVLDITIRSSEDRSTRKSFDTFTPLGPVVVTADDVADAANLDLRLTVNGEERQSSNTSKLIYGIPELIAYASSVTTLEPGDVIATGTPSGVSEIFDGDVVTVVIDGIGELTVDVTNRRAVPHADRPGPKTALRRS
ncbi:fumarylacetoacetate hydrolase family protein [Salinibacterium hongtaonis]|uniref:FAA hydrolase family protein n=1 Tax=Homoserinimonas hongtaonis TaxID=2079791 RepID=A0A2U1T2E9_9MICO|nr:fumarylacetoacetate hydrolase family protein [Salinibacterium hongtaonis]PWB98020.1 FAA hydrolase family protein [Salinibacterium hongtaonis]